MNEIKESEKTTQLFLQMDESVAAARLLPVSQPKVDYLEDAIVDGRTVIVRTALFGGAVFTALDAIRSIAEALREKDPVMYSHIDRLFGRILSYQDIYKVFYGEEIKFCTGFNDNAEFCKRLVRAYAQMTVVESGASPAAGQMALKRLQEVALLTQPASAGN